MTGARVERIGHTSMTVHMATWEQESGRLVAEAKQVHVAVSGRDFRPVPVPDELRKAIEASQGPVDR